MFLQLSFLVSTLFLCDIADSYKIDASCTQAGLGKNHTFYRAYILVELILAGAKINFALQSAFDMAEAGKAALQSGKNTPDGQDIIRPFEVEQLVDYLFYKGDNRGQDIRRMRLIDAYGTFALPNCEIDVQTYISRELQWHSDLHQATGTHRKA
jgi:hypothetical protein